MVVARLHSAVWCTYAWFLPSKLTETCPYISAHNFGSRSTQYFSMPFFADYSAER